MLSKLRRRLDAAVARRVDERVAGMEERLRQAEVVFGDERERSEARARDYEARLGGTQADFDFLRSEFDRLAPQLASLETRIAEIESTGVGGPAEEDRGLEHARREHERARIRSELISHYEERLRRLEARDA